jgi:Protein of unknown function (DUF2924)
MQTTPITKCRTIPDPIPDPSTVSTPHLLAPPERLEDLKTWPRYHLVRLWQGLFETKPPKGASQPLLAALMAYDIQAQRHGGLGVREQHKLSRLASGEPEKITTPHLKPGARLVREWNGVSHVVDIREEGVFYRDQHYRSLSAVARAITGAHWSGPRFFGLINRKRAA